MVSLLGDLLDVETPIIDSFIIIGSAINKIDYFKEGRTLQDMGLGGLSEKEIKRFVETGKVK